MVAARMFAALWLTGVVYVVVFVGLWWPWYGADPARLAGPAVSGVCNAAFVVVCVRGRVPGWVVAGKVALGIGFAASARAWLPPSVVSESTTWVFTAVIAAGMVAAWCIRAAWWVVVPAAGGLAFAAGAGVLGVRLLWSEMLIFAVAGLFRVAGRRLRRSATDADAWLDTAGERQHRAAVAAARDRDRREQERVIHDTVLNTLTGIGWGGAGEDVEQARARCERSVAAVRRLWAGGGPSSAAGFARRIEEVVADAVRAGGLDVTVSDEVGAGADLDSPLGGGLYDDVPAEVGEAVGAALAEVLSNVRRHAGTGLAWVTLSREAGGGVRVEARDEGVGFDPASPRPGRLGLRESVAGRLADVGGSTEIRSSPGAGTTVVLSWRPGRRGADGTSGRGADGTSGAGAGGTSGTAGRSLALPAAAGRLRRDYAASLRRSVGVSAAAWVLLLLVPLAVSWSRYPMPGLAAAMWSVSAAAVGAAVRVSWGRALHRREAAGLVLVAVAGTSAMGFATRAEDVPTAVNFFGVQAVPMLLMLVAASRPVREWVPAALVTDAVVLWVGVGRAGSDPATLTKLFANGYGTWTLLIILAALGPALRSTAEATARAAEAEAELTARRKSAAAISRDRRRRHRHLEAETLPVLNSIAEGGADPRTDAVRRACATQATLLRRRLATSARPGHLGQLEAVVEAAEARGVTVQVQLDGDLTQAPEAVHTEVVDTVGEALGTVPSGPALITVLCSDTGGSVYVTFPASRWNPSNQSIEVGRADRRAGAPPPPLPPSTAARSGTGLTEVHTEVEDGRACLEVCW